jgi:hypothetical protein
MLVRENAGDRPGAEQVAARKLAATPGFQHLVPTITDLYRNLALQDQFRGSSKELWQFSQWAIASAGAVARTRAWWLVRALSVVPAALACAGSATTVVR